MLRLDSTGMELYFLIARYHDCVELGPEVAARRNQLRRNAPNSVYAKKIQLGQVSYLWIGQSTEISLAECARAGSEFLADSLPLSCLRLPLF